MRTVRSRLTFMTQVTASQYLTFEMLTTNPNLPKLLANF